MTTPNNNDQAPIGAEHVTARKVNSSVCKKLKLVGFNAQGTIQKLFELMRQIKNYDGDVIFLQETNLTTSSEKEFLDTALKHGYLGFLSNKGQRNSVGGTAILIKCESRHINTDSIKHNAHTDMNGRVCRIIAELAGIETQLVSIYAPSAAPQLLAFFKDLIDKKIIQPNSIVEGDFNCVENISLDTKYKAGSQTTYANLHGKELAKHMADIGLVDIYRMLNPKKRAGFTRIGRSVMSRNDRWYGQYDASPWRWRNVDSSISLFRTGINQSDHYAITATVETIGDRPPLYGRNED